LLAGLMGVACQGDPEGQTVDKLRAQLAPLRQGGLSRLVSGDTIRVSQTTLDFYRRRGFRPAWFEDGSLEARGQSVLEALRRSSEDGLSPSTYRTDVAMKLLGRLDSEGDEELPDSLESSYAAAIEVLLTEGFVRYANDLVAGTVDPNESGVEWRIPRGGARGDRVLQALLQGRPPAQVVAQLRPSIPYYDRMRQALAKHDSLAARGGWSKVPERGYEPGKRSNAVSLLRARLVNGLDATESGLARKGAADPTLYDAELKRAVEHFQQRHAIEPDGVPGEATVRELNRSVEERIAELRLNLDRWRWLPDDLGERFLIVNIAGFELELVDRNRVIESMNVVVGQRNWQTPVMADTMENIVINPYWNVPPSIYEQEILPNVERDPGWLARNNYEHSGTTVRQRPGPDNALGQYKFVFPNADDIYLHDTPAGHLFSRTRRDFSHGCIRIERPADLARLLVRLQTSKNPAILPKLVASGREQWIKLERPLPVYLVYFTVWSELDGTLRFHHDVYGKDEQLQTESRIALKAR
jgi:murein L,D-transpeptidase YcbB/YkuD